jgi:predicted amidohydrolase
MKIYCCQFDIAWEDKQSNFAKVESMLSSARLEEGALVQLPEMFATGFSMNVAGIQEGDRRETAQFMARLARERKIFVLGGLVMATPSGLGLNQAVGFSPDGTEIVRYTKIQPFSLGGEMEHYAAGHRVHTFDWHGLTVAPFVCYDLRFPEIFRIGARKGAQLITVMANWPDTRIQHWVTLLQARAIENQAYVAGVNRCGASPHLHYNGRSIIVGPGGEILADAGHEEKVIDAEVDAKALMTLREKLPFLRDMRREYTSLE